MVAARPGDSRALLGLGLVLGATERADAAIDTFNRAVEADPRNDEARFARAEVLERLGGWTPRARTTSGSRREADAPGPPQGGRIARWTR